MNGKEVEKDLSKGSSFDYVVVVVVDDDVDDDADDDDNNNVLHYFIAYDRYTAVYV